MSNEESNKNKPNPFTPCNQRKKLTLPISELIELDDSEEFKITFCCLLTEYIRDTKKFSELREVLNAVAAYVIDPEKDYFYTKSAGFFELNDKKIFFRERHNSILIGFLSETEYIARFAEYQYYSLKAVVEATVDTSREAVEDF